MLKNNSTKEKTICYSSNMKTPANTLLAYPSSFVNTNNQVILYTSVADSCRHTSPPKLPTNKTYTSNTNSNFYDINDSDVSFLNNSFSSDCANVFSSYAGKAEADVSKEKFFRFCSNLNNDMYCSSTSSSVSLVNNKNLTFNSPITTASSCSFLTSQTSSMYVPYSFFNISSSYNISTSPFVSASSSTVFNSPQPRVCNDNIYYLNNPVLVNLEGLHNKAKITNSYTENDCKAVFSLKPKISSESKNPSSSSCGSSFYYSSPFVSSFSTHSSFSPLKNVNHENLDETNYKISLLEDSQSYGINMNHNYANKDILTSKIQMGNINNASSSFISCSFNLPCSSSALPCFPSPAAPFHPFCAPHMTYEENSNDSNMCKTITNNMEILYKNSNNIHNNNNTTEDNNQNSVNGKNNNKCNNEEAMITANPRPSLPSFKQLTQRKIQNSSLKFKKSSCNIKHLVENQNNNSKNKGYDKGHDNSELKEKQEESNEEEKESENGYAEYDYFSLEEVKNKASDGEGVKCRDKKTEYIHVLRQKVKKYKNQINDLKGERKNLKFQIENLIFTEFKNRQIILTLTAKTNSESRKVKNLQNEVEMARAIAANLKHQNALTNKKESADFMRIIKGEYCTAQNKNECSSSSASPSSTPSSSPPVSGEPNASNGYCENQEMKIEAVQKDFKLKEMQTKVLLMQNEIKLLTQALILAQEMNTELYDANELLRFDLSENRKKDNNFILNKPKELEESSKKIDNLNNCSSQPFGLISNALSERIQKLVKNKSKESFSEDKISQPVASEENLMQENTNGRALQIDVSLKKGAKFGKQCACSNQINIDTEIKEQNEREKYENVIKTIKMKNNNMNNNVNNNMNNNVNYNSDHENEKNTTATNIKYQKNIQPPNQPASLPSLGRSEPSSVALNVTNSKCLNNQNKRNSANFSKFTNFVPSFGDIELRREKHFLLSQ